MCIILFAYQVVPEYPLILIANRDELYDRPALPAGWWPDEPDIYAGRDFTAGGTWLGVSRSGRFAAVTNYRNPKASPGTRSRGELVAGFLKSKESTRDYVHGISRSRFEFSPFNLLAGIITPERSELYYLSSRGDDLIDLEPGIWGLSNHLLDTDWPKVRRGKEKLGALINDGIADNEDLFDLLSDATLAADDDLPNTGIPYKREKALSSIFIATSDYGTRCSSVLKFGENGEWTFDERTYV